MNRLTRLFVLTVASFGLAACGDGASPDARMPGMPSGAPAGSVQHVADGTLNSIDRAAGTVNVSHGPVPSADWPAMTMSFKLADGAAAAGLEAGQRVEFQFTIESGMSATITRITPAD